MKKMRNGYNTTKEELIQMLAQSKFTWKSEDLIEIEQEPEEGTDNEFHGEEQRK